MRENPIFKEAVNITITPLLSTLSLIENTESKVLGLGLSVIALNLEMYLTVPLIVIIGIRKRF
jgi:peptidyl-prolyl cis-trans isomerase B (cyclophilin B)